MVVADRSEQPGLCLETAGSRKFSPEGTHPARLNLDHDRRFTDAIDACVIAHFGKATGVAPRPLPDQATQQLADLSPASDREEDIMDKAFDVKPNSRLGCQSKILRETTVVCETSRESRQAFLDEHPEIRAKLKEAQKEAQNEAPAKQDAPQTSSGTMGR